MCVIDYIENKRKSIKDIDKALLGLLWKTWWKKNIFSINVPVDYKGINTRKIIKVTDENYFKEYEQIYKYFNPCKRAFVEYKESDRKGKIMFVGNIKGTAVKKWFGNECLFCGSDKGLHVSHIVPFRKSNDDTVYNLYAVCENHSRYGLRFPKDHLLKNFIVPKLKRLHPDIK